MATPRKLEVQRVLTTVQVSCCNSQFSIDLVARNLEVSVRALRYFTAKSTGLNPKTIADCLRAEIAQKKSAEGKTQEVIGFEMGMISSNTVRLLFSVPQERIDCVLGLLDKHCGGEDPPSVAPKL